VSHKKTSRAFFERMYSTNSDPWNFASSEYELRRYQTILNALGGNRFEHAFEPGCSIGVLTEQLAARCDRVDAIDISPRAVELTKARCRNLTNVHIACGSLLHHTLAGTFDLIMFCEIGYYFHEVDLRRIVLRLSDSMKSGATMLAAHWLGSSPDHVLSGDDVHGILGDTESLMHRYAERHSGFRLDRWSRR